MSNVLIVGNTRMGHAAQLLPIATVRMLMTSVNCVIAKMHNITARSTAKLYRHNAELTRYQREPVSNVLAISFRRQYARYGNNRRCKKNT